MVSKIWMIIEPKQPRSRPVTEPMNDRDETYKKHLGPGPKIWTKLLLL